MGLAAHRHQVADELCAGYAPHAKQSAVHASGARYLVVCAGRRGGKTMCASAEFLSRIYRTLLEDAPGAPAPDAPPIFSREPRRRYWVVAPSYDLARPCEQYLWRWLPQSVLAAVNAGKVAGWSRQERRLWLPGDVEIAFRTADDPLKLVGVSLDGVWLTEAARLKSDAWPLLRPALADRGGWLIAESTPLGRNWLFDQLIKPAQEGADGWAWFTWYASDNPSIPREEIERAKREMPDRYYRREMEASLDAFIGQVFEVFEHKRHQFNGVAAQSLKHKRVVAGVDFGYASPGAVVVLGERGDGVYEVVAEDYAPHRTLPEWLRCYLDIRSRFRVSTWYADPSAPMLIEEMRRAGLVTVGADNDIGSGIQLMTSLLHQDRLRVHADCKHLLDEIVTYRWRESPHYGVMEEPAPCQDDHAIDALRYAVMGESKPAAFRALH